MNKEIDSGLLLHFVERIENLEDDAKQVAEDIKEVYSQAKAQGYDPKMLRFVIKLRKLSPDELYKVDELTKMYRDAVGL